MTRPRISTCEACIYFNEWEKRPGVEMDFHGECRKAAPVVVQQGVNAGYGAFSIVKRGVWCGDFHRDAERVRLFQCKHGWRVLGGQMCPDGCVE